MKGKSYMIMWNKVDVGSDCSIFLAPAGAQDTKTIYSKIASSISNSGSYSWTPDSSMSPTEVELIIVDSSTIVISGSFWLVSDSSSYYSGSDKGSGWKNNTHGSHDSGMTESPQSHDTTTYESYDSAMYENQETTTQGYGGGETLSSTAFTPIQILTIHRLHSLRSQSMGLIIPSPLA